MFTNPTRLVGLLLVVTAVVGVQPSLVGMVTLAIAALAVGVMLTRPAAKRRPAVVRSDERRRHAAELRRRRLDTR